MTASGAAHVRASLAVAAAFSIAIALRIGRGNFNLEKQNAIFVLLLTGVLALAAAFLPRGTPEAKTPGPAGSVLVLLLTVGLGISCLALFVLLPGIYLQHPLRGELVPMALAGAVALAVAHLLPEKLLGAKAAFALAGVAGIALALTGAAVLAASPAPMIDVWTLQQGASQALLAGENPYAAMLPDAWPPGKRVDYFPYPPLSLLLTLPGYLLGDVRIALLAASIAVLAPVAWLASRARDPFAFRCALLAAACLAIRQPWTLVLEQSWTEPLSLALFACVAVLWRKGRLDAAAVCFGLALASKQYFLVIGPLLLLFPGARIRHCAIALATVVLTFVPFALADGRALWNDTFLVLARWPPRYDSLTVTSWLHLRYGTDASGLLSLSLPVPVFALALFRGWQKPDERSEGLALLTIGATLLAAFLVAKQSHTNYYDLVAGLLFLGAIVTLSEIRGATTEPA